MLLPGLCPCLEWKPGFSCRPPMAWLVSALSHSLGSTTWLFYFGILFLLWLETPVQHLKLCFLFPMSGSHCSPEGMFTVTVTDQA